MIRFCQQNKDSVLAKMLNGQLDAVASSTTNFVDEIILAMHKKGVLGCLKDSITDRRADNTTIPFELVLALSIAAKMKIKTSLTDIPFAITDHRSLAELGYALIDTEGDLNKGLMRESSLRFLIQKYSHFDFFLSYNKTVQNYIMPKLDLLPDIHILDCTKLKVNFTNSNYEGSGIASDSDGNTARGYKLATLRGITENSGIIEDIRFGSMNIHDLVLSEDILYNSPVLKPGDILINDRGFLSRDVINYLKSEREIDTYIPLRKNMEIYYQAVSTAKLQNNWIKHPKRENQTIALVQDIGVCWDGSDPKNNVDLNACVVWDTQYNEFSVFVTTDLTQSASQIIKTYELRPEIEEDYRQIKDFWKIEDFKSTNLTMIAFHIICVLFGYLFFQLYTMLPEGEQYNNKSLPIILKNYIPQALNYLIFFVGYEFGIFKLLEFAKLYQFFNDKIKARLEYLMG